MHLTALLLTLDAVIAVPTDYVVDKKTPINLLINTSIPLLPSASRYYAELLVAVAGRFPPRRTEDLCASGQTRQRSPPYLLILGAGNSGTGGVAQLLQGLGVNISHEHMSPAMITHGHGLSSWISTVLGERTFCAWRAHLPCLAGGMDLEPRCRRTVALLQVRHPRSVLRSVNGANRGRGWDFSYHGVRAWDWVPRRLRALWHRLSRAAQGLLWWSSFCLLAEAQLGPASVAWRMEDIFYAHDPRPVIKLLQLAKGVSGAGAPERVAAALQRAAPYNSHASSHAVLEVWDDLFDAARAVANETLRAAEEEALEVARALALRYGYTTRRRRR